MKYVFTVTESLVKSVVIEASSEDEAYKKGFDMYRDEEIVLYPDDYLDTEFDIEEYKDGE